jgi:PKD domain
MLLVGAASVSAAHARRTARTAAADARVIGTFAMQADVTEAVNVRGEHRGQLLQRRWTLTAAECEASVCQTLQLQRQRSAGITEAVTLKRTGAGSYAGRGSFYVPLRCKGRLYLHGARAPYSITLAVVTAEAVQRISFARTIRARYVNRRRIDRTACPLGLSHDAATYSGSATGPLPTPPSASFTAATNEDTLSATFTALLTPGAGGAPIVSTQWSFGDPASGAADSSTEAAPTHLFSAPGSYTVMLTATDANGLSATVSEPVQI